MEKAVLKTLNYADIFEYPLKAWEIHKWLIGRKVSLYQIEKAVEKLVQSGKCKVLASRSGGSGYYFLPKRVGIVAKRLRRQKQSANYLRKAKMLTTILKLVPWIKLVGISGGLAVDNASKIDDIDLFIITSKNRLWFSRILALGLLSLTGQRRKVGEKGKKIAGKVCINTLLEEDRLEQTSKDIYLAHEVLQMKVLWQRDGIYGKYLEKNSWVFKFLPNWVGSSGEVVSSRYYYVVREEAKNVHTTNYILHATINLIEKIAKKFQLWYMKPPKGMERIEDGALYFHPQDIRPKILKLYQQKISRA